MKLAKEGYVPVVTLLFMIAGAWLIARPLAVILLLPLAIVIWFYRDPERMPPLDSNYWVSPADGKVVEIEEADDPYAGKSIKIGIFMSGFDVHVNRFPAAGTAEGFLYVPGKKWFAIAPKASLENERLYVHVMTEQGKTTLVQIAGILARRISCHIRKGDTLARGARYGMIKLGSKVDVYLPLPVQPSVSLGQRVKAGESVIGVVRE